MYPQLTIGHEYSRLGNKKIFMNIISNDHFVFNSLIFFQKKILFPKHQKIEHKTW